MVMEVSSSSPESFPFPPLPQCEQLRAFSCVTGFLQSVLEHINLVKKSCTVRGGGVCSVKAGSIWGSTAGSGIVGNDLCVMVSVRAVSSLGPAQKIEPNSSQREGIFIREQLLPSRGRLWGRTFLSFGGPSAYPSAPLFREGAATGVTEQCTGRQLVGIFLPGMLAVFRALPTPLADHSPCHTCFR
jgi:hypothetical protein